MDMVKIYLPGRKHLLNSQQHPIPMQCGNVIPGNPQFCFKDECIEHSNLLEFATTGATIKNNAVRTFILCCHLYMNWNF